MVCLAAFASRFRATSLALGFWIFVMVPGSVWCQTQSPASSSSLTGTLRDADGHPVANAYVCLQKKEKDQAPVIVQTNADGVYHFSKVPPGTYTLKLESTGDGEAAVSLEAKESKVVDLKLRDLKVSSASAQKAASGAKPEFFDEPHFTVAGVTEAASPGGHGSDAVVRNRESLVKATGALRGDAAASTPVVADGALREGDGDYEAARVRVQALLAQADKAELHHQLASLDEHLGKSLEAVREYERAAMMSPSEPYWFDWGAELLVHEAPEPAGEVFTKGTRLFPNSIRMRMGLGVALFVRGLNDDAVAQLCQASDLDPSNPEPYLFLGRIEEIEKFPPEHLVEKLARFAAVRPKDALANYYYAMGLWKRNRGSANASDVARVQALLENALRLDPKLGLAQLQLGIVYAEQKDLPRAISAFEQAVKVSPELEQAHYRLGQAYHQAGDNARAEAEFEIFKKVSKEQAQEADRQRHEVQQFVYTLRDPSSSAPPATPH
jgi:tetratricopeptide (TPR) repeat protein